MLSFHAIGLMSGTSLDGLDIAFCRFDVEEEVWKCKILNANTLPYSAAWREKLATAHTLQPIDLLALHSEYGQWLGRTCREFMEANCIDKLNCISSHGHTIYHQPNRNFTFQLGDGNAIHAETGVPVVFDFRSLDVHLGGQGAPLVPIGDKFLFSEYSICLNLGGIANLSIKKDGQIVAFDVCFANMGLNYLSSKLGLIHDDNGDLASSGAIDVPWLDRLNEFHKPIQATRCSLAREQFESGLAKILDDSSLLIPNKLCTFCECIAVHVASAIPSGENQTVLITGGGAYNKYLVSRIEHHLSGKARVVIPSKEIIEYKEALVFAFLGVLRLRNEVNVLKEVTGASRDSCSGVLVG